MRYIKKGILVRCSRNPSRVDMYNLIIDDNRITLEPVQIEEIKEYKDILKHAAWITLDFFYTYTYNNKEKPLIKELITVLSYELSIPKEEAWKIFEILNYYGLILIDGERFYVKIP